MPIIRDLKKQRQEESEFEVGLLKSKLKTSPNYLMRIYLKIIISNNNDAYSIVMTGEIVKW